MFQQAQALAGNRDALGQDRPQLPRRPMALRDSALVDERDRRAGSIHKRGDGLDLNQLIVIAQHCDAHQGAGHVVVAERVTNNRPRRTQVRLTRRSNQDASADHVFDRRASRPKRLRQRLNALGGLPA